jgi:hypothetical protein
MFKTVLLFIINSLFLIASGLPSSIESSIISINKSRGEITLSKNVPSGRAGIVIHNYGKGLEAITYSAISLKPNRALVKKYNWLEHDNIPNIKTTLKVGDKVIFGNLYNNVLLIAPNEQVYKRIVKLMPDRLWIHPDLYAYYFIEKGEDRVTIESLREFAIKSLVGLVAIVAKDGLRVLDPISGKYLRKIPLNLNFHTAQTPFYARFEGVDDTFSKNSSSNLNRYLKEIEEIR